MLAIIMFVHLVTMENQLFVFKSSRHHNASVMRTTKSFYSLALFGYGLRPAGINRFSLMHIQHNVAAGELWVV